MCLLSHASLSWNGNQSWEDEAYGSSKESVVIKGAITAFSTMSDKGCRPKVLSQIVQTTTSLRRLKPEWRLCGKEPWVLNTSSLTTVGLSLLVDGQVVYPGYSDLPTCLTDLDPNKGKIILKDFKNMSTKKNKTLKLGQYGMTKRWGLFHLILRYNSCII